MEQLGALPSAEVVLDKLKSDGTFDQFRKTCSAAIEAEPSFRAHGEHLEVLSRRYLQDFNWRESTTRNEVRSKLRQHVLGVIARGPELHVGMPLAAILEKTLESKANDLLPQIMDTVESLRALKPQQSSQSDSGNAHSLTGSQTTPSSSTSTSTAEQTTASTTSKKELGTLDLGLPIDIIPGLGAPPKKEPVGGGGEGKTTKSKLKQNDGAILKDGVKGPARPKMVVTSGNKGTAAVKEGAKEKEKEDNKGPVEKESEIVTGKEKVKMSNKPKNPKEETKEKTAAGQNKESSEKPQDKATVKPHTGGGKEKDKPGDAKKGGKKDGSEGEPNKTELKSEQKEVSKGGVPKGKETEGQLATPAEKEPQEMDTAGGSSRRKQHTPTRRSARIASISESKEQSKQKESETEGEKENSSSRQESDGSEGDAGVERKQVKQLRRRRRKRPRETDKAPSGSRKKARVLLSSSSEESEREESEADLERVEEGYKSESETKEEEGKPSKMVKGKSRERRKPRVHEAPQRQPRRSRKRGLPQSQKEDTQGQPKRSKMVAASKQSSTTLLKKQFKLKLHRFSSPPMVKTRYNRLVKPNRKYSPAGELSNLESEENSEEQKQDEEEEEEEKEEKEEEEEEGEKAISESVEGENTSEEELPAKMASKTYRRRTKK